MAVRSSLLHWNRVERSRSIYSFAYLTAQRRLASAMERLFASVFQPAAQISSSRQLEVLVYALHLESHTISSQVRSSIVVLDSMQQLFMLQDGAMRRTRAVRGQRLGRCVRSKQTS